MSTSQPALGSPDRGDTPVPSVQYLGYLAAALFFALWLRAWLKERGRQWTLADAYSRHAQQPDPY